MSFEVVVFEQQSNAGRTPAGVFAAMLALGACAQGQGYDTGTTSLGGVGLGTGGGAGAGALLGRAIAGKHDNTLAILGGALLGGVAGNVLVDRPNQIRGQQRAAGRRHAEQQRQLDYERQSQLQQAQVQREIRSRTSTSSGSASAAAGPRRPRSPPPT